MSSQKLDKSLIISSLSVRASRRVSYITRSDVDSFKNCSQLEAEINEKLLDVHNKLLQAGVDRKESEREAKLKETLANLQRIFPGE